MTDTTATGTATVVRAGEGTAVRWGPAGRMRVIAGAASTDRAFTVCATVEEPGGGAPLHRHRGEAEAFYVLEGEVELTCGEQTVTAGPGDFVSAPQGVPHGFRVLGDRQLRMLLLFSRPGFESFFLEAGAPLDAPPGPPDLDALQRAMDRHGIELLERPEH